MIVRRLAWNGGLRLRLIRRTDLRGEFAATLCVRTAEFVETDQSVSPCRVPICKNISVSAHPKSNLQPLPSRPPEGRIAIVTDVGCGMRWTRQRFARDG